jgi:hypothetical protein
VQGAKALVEVVGVYGGVGMMGIIRGRSIESRSLGERVGLVGMELRRRGYEVGLLVMGVMVRVVEIVESAEARLTTGAVMVHCGLSIRQARRGERRWLRVGEEETHAESIDALASRTGMGRG